MPSSPAVRFSAHHLATAHDSPPAVRPLCRREAPRPPPQAKPNQVKSSLKSSQIKSSRVESSRVKPSQLESRAPRPRPLCHVAALLPHHQVCAAGWLRTARLRTTRLRTARLRTARLRTTRLRTARLRTARRCTSAPSKACCCPSARVTGAGRENACTACMAAN